MDTNWAIERLERYLATCDRLHKARAASADLKWDDEATAINSEAELQLATVERIVARITPRYAIHLSPPSRIQNETVRYVRQALGALRDAAEVEEMMRPESPALSADRLHPLIWAAAAPIWHTGQFRTVVGQAVVALKAEIKAKAESTLNDSALVSQVFSPNAVQRTQQVRLQFPGDQSDDTWRSRQLGLQQRAQGAFSGIRNVAAHTDEEWSEHEALEHLAVLSVVARWLEGTEPVRFTEA